MRKITVAAVSSVVILVCVDMLLGMDALDVVAHYEKTMDKYRSIDVIYSVTYSRRPDLPKRCQWIYDASGKQRLRTTGKTELTAAAYTSVFPGRMTGSSMVIDFLSDYMDLGDTYYQLEDFNPGRRTPLTPLTQNQARTAVWRANNWLKSELAFTFSLPRTELQMSHQFFFRCEPLRRLSEEVQEAINLFGRQAVGCVKETVAGHECWKLTYPYPGCIQYDKLEGRGDKVALYFDQSVGWLLCRKSFHSTTTGLPNMVFDVRKFTALRDGLWFPLEQETQVTYTNGNVETSVLTVERVVVNEPIDETRWVFRFPPGAEVGEGELLSEKEKVLSYVHIVGADGTFVKTYNTDSKEWQQY